MLPNTYLYENRMLTNTVNLLGGKGKVRVSFVQFLINGRVRKKGLRGAV